ncbi:uncharacterized protein C7orf50 [Kryptolebias marmoratus]|uniref:uncharacterized protein C7orf50 n=1 Tax=Kryptolebias marmoratus TaxID=37003 RepID=UPI0007F933D7|nr:uncharacterized protein C7orf50 [Kryptolebias marmoratus]XP_017273954.1 uncharacterized protein C7orf50 [Kryptolebias marmoratus]XP_037836959.1 uncharacterized protein C7orf50 [Kryptolebias marmoratus]
MAKDKSLKSKSKLLKRNKLSSDDIKDFSEEQVKKKRKHVEAEEAPVQIHPVTNSPDDKKCKKNKKRKKKSMKEETHTKQTETPDPSSRPEETHEPEGGEDQDQDQDLSPEEKRVLERKLKKILKKEEKKRLKEEGRTLPKNKVTGPSASKQALDYLTCWAENRSEWKFQKTRQTWLLQHMFDSEQVPDEKFSAMLEYLEGLCGRAKDTTVQKALSVVEESGQAAEDSGVQQRAQRAREVIQLLS